MEKSCGAVVYREENGKRLYLILHYDEGHYDFPKGHVEAGESEEETTRRETREETGITDLAFAKNFREIISYFYTREHRKIYKEVIFFIAKTTEEKITLSDEHVGFKWMEYDNAMTALTYKNAKDILKKADAHLSSSLTITPDEI